MKDIPDWLSQNGINHNLMNNNPFPDNAPNTLLAALADVATAADRQAKLREMAEAASDPMYLADMREVNEDFAFADAENI